MAEAKTQTNGSAHTNGAPAGVHRWPAQIRACEMLGLNHRQLGALVKSGELPEPVRAPDGTLRYDPGALYEYQQRNPKNEKDPTVTSENVKAGTELVREAQAHSFKVAQMYLDRMDGILSMQQEIIRDLRAENHELHSERRAVTRERDELESEKTARDIATMQAASAEERKRVVFEQLKIALPTLGSQLKASIFSKQNPALERFADVFAKLQPSAQESVLRLLKDMTPEMLTGLLEVLAGQAKDEDDAKPAQPVPEVVNVDQ